MNLLIEIINIYLLNFYNEQIKLLLIYFIKKKHI